MRFEGVIVKGLLEGRRCVGEVEGLLHISQANTSQHLNVLKANGIVDCVREGSSRCYFLKDPECVQKILGVLAQRKG